MSTVVKPDISNGDLSQQPPPIASPTSPLMEPDLVCMDDIQPTTIKWLWEMKIPLGCISLLVGRPGICKSLLTMFLSAQVSKGASWPDGSKNQKGSVILITSEDHPSDTMAPRLIDFGADQKKIHWLRGLKVLKGLNAEPDRLAFTLQNVDQLENTIRKVEDCRLVVIDPIGSFGGKGIDFHKDNEVRSLLTPVIKIAESYGVAVVIVAHRRKAESSFADETTMGSIAFPGISRAVWHLSIDRDNSERRLFLPGKFNLSTQPKGLAFNIKSDPLRLEWDQNPVDVTADDALSRERNGSGGHSAVNKAVDWLRTALSGGPRSAKELFGEAKEDGISKRTLERAKERIGAESKQGKVGGPWTWFLPPGNAPQTANTEIGGLVIHTNTFCFPQAANIGIGGLG